MTSQTRLTSPSPAAARSAWPAPGARPSAALRTIVLDAGDPGAWRVAAGMLAPVAEAAVRRAARCSSSACDARARLRRVLRRAGRGRRARPGSRRARCWSRATATRPRRSTARSPSGASSACEVEWLRPSAGAPRRAGAGAHRPARARRARRPLGRPAAAGRRPARPPSSAPAASTRRGRVVAGVLDGGVRSTTARSSAPAGSCSRPAPAQVGPRPACPGPPGQGPDPAPARPARRRLIERTIRGPRSTSSRAATARYVLGATMEERGFDTAPTAGGVSSCCAT